MKLQEIRALLTIWWNDDKKYTAYEQKKTVLIHLSLIKKKKQTTNTC